MGMIGSVDQRLKKSFLGRRLRESVLESSGYDIDFEGRNKGFLGIKSSYKDIYGGGGLRSNWNNFAGRAASDPRAALKGAGGKALRFGGRTLMSSFGLASSLYFMYSGYQEGGIFGAAKGAGEGVLYGAAFRTAIMGLGAPLTVGAMAVAAVGYGAYAVGEAGRRYERGIRNLEVSGDENMINAINSYGASTMRQRAAVALNNSHINRRLALGNEAAMFHSSFRR